MKLGILKKIASIGRFYYTNCNFCFSLIALQKIMHIMHSTLKNHQIWKKMKKSLVQRSFLFRRNLIWRIWFPKCWMTRQIRRASFWGKSRDAFWKTTRWLILVSHSYYSLLKRAVYLVSWYSINKQQGTGDSQIQYFWKLYLKEQFSKLD